MDDDELLKLAAKAAGIEHIGDEPIVMVDRNTYRDWDPLNDDGDALRLAVKLGIDVMQDPEVAEVHTNYASVGIGFNTLQEYGTDPYAATRRAIVRAAAAMGMQP